MLELHNLNITYERKILENVEFHTSSGYFCLIQGESGSGKTTLLYRLALISDQDDYEYHIDNYDLMNMSLSKRDMFRRNNIAFLLQNALLIEEYNVKENINFFAGIINKKMNDDEIIEILKQVHLNVPFEQKIQTLSGGERQRLAIACALVKDTSIIILDEPTSSLDKENEEAIFQLLQDIAHKQNKVIIVSSHSKIADKYADIIYKIENCQLKLINHQKDNNKTIVQNKALSLSHIIEYLKKHIMILKKKTVSAIMIMCVALLFILLLNFILDRMKINSINEIVSLSENQVFITSHNDNIYGSDDDPVLAESSFSNVSIKYKSYPYVNAFMMIDEIRVDVIPLFKENDLTNKYESQYNILDEKGAVLSQSLYKYLKRNDITVRSIDNTIYIHYLPMSYQCNVRGILKEGVVNSYTNNEYYIYLSYDVIEELYSMATNQKEYTGYTIFSEDITAYNQLINELDNYDLDVNKTFINIESINNVVDNIENMRIVFYVAAVIIVVIIMVYYLLHHFNQRKKEFVVDIVAGYSLKNIYALICMEILSYLIVSFVIFLVVCLLFFIVLNYTYYVIIVYSFLLILGVYIISCLMCMIDMKKISVENILRD